MNNPVVWWEIASPDAKVTAGFCKTVFGWDLDYDAATRIYELPEPPPDNSFAGGSIFTPKPGGVDPHTTIYVRVDDVDAVCRLAVEAGGTVYVPTKVVSDTTRICLVKDPVGVILAAVDKRG